MILFSLTMPPCDQCPGYCCFRRPGAVLLVTAEDINRLARHLGTSDQEVRRRYLENRYTFKVGADGGCVFLGAGRTSGHCSVYEARPDQCRRFPFDRPCPYLEKENPLTLTEAATS